MQENENIWTYQRKILSSMLCRTKHISESLCHLIIWIDVFIFDAISVSSLLQAVHCVTNLQQECSQLAMNPSLYYSTLALLINPRFMGTLPRLMMHFKQSSLALCHLLPRFMVSNFLNSHSSINNKENHIMRRHIDSNICSLQHTLIKLCFDKSKSTKIQMFTFTHMSSPRFIP